MSQIKLIGIPPPLWLADPSVCSDWARPLQQQLQEAYDSSPLPDTPTNRAALDDFVVRVRLACA